MKHLRLTCDKEPFDDFQRRHAQFFKNSETESLSNRGIDAVKNRVGTGAFHPFGAAFGKQTEPRLRELNACASFGPFQSARKGEVRKQSAIAALAVAAIHMPHIPVIILADIFIQLFSWLPLY